MTAPRNSRAVGGKRLYQWRSEGYWSSTTIISGGVPKPALLPWGMKGVAVAACNIADQLPALVREDREAAINMLKGIPYAQRDRAADLGSLVHAWIEAHRLGKPMPKPTIDVMPYLAAFEKFVEDFQPVYEMAEATVYSRKHRYAGTLDAIARLALPLREEGEQRFILDAKTGKSVYPEVGLQLASYRFADFIGLADGSEAPLPEVDGALALHLAPGRYRLIEVRADEPIFRAFLHAKEVFRWQEDTSKTVLGEEWGADVVEEVAV